jgi:hypothetical protein
VWRIIPAAAGVENIESAVDNFTVVDARGTMNGRKSNSTGRIRSRTSVFRNIGVSASA